MYPPSENFYIPGTWKFQDNELWYGQFFCLLCLVLKDPFSKEIHIWKFFVLFLYYFLDSFFSIFFFWNLCQSEVTLPDRS